VSNFFVLVRAYSPYDSAKQCASFVDLSPSTHICANSQQRHCLCSACTLAYHTPGKRSHFWDNNPSLRQGTGKAVVFGLLQK